MRYFCHDQPDVLTVETRVMDARPGAVLLERSPFYPGGGGQLADRGVVRWPGGEARVRAIELDGERLWHLLDEPVEIAGAVEAAVDRELRAVMTELHTDAHVVSALVFREFRGALITGAQLNADGTARVDFDLPEADNDRLRALEPAINDVIGQDLAVRHVYAPVTDAATEPGLLRSRSVAPPPSADGLVRIVEIVGLDRQACGGTHLGSTRQSRPVRILKVDNKGRHNRRIRFTLAER
jgi:misacylated tRNA(Ala) deacylase